MHRRAVLAAVAGAAVPLPAPGRTLAVAVGERLDQAVAAAADGDVIELEPGEHHGQSALILQRRLTLRAASGTAVLHADGAHAEGKALLVVRQGQVLIEGLEFRGARVPDGNGAGIRFERGELTVRRCRFFDNEMGLLSANTPAAELAIEHCEFGLAPRHAGRLHHLLYVGRMRRFTLRHSRLSGGWRGHLVKSRAARSLILCNHIDDGQLGGASYEIDLPNGGQAWVMGNVIGQGPQPQNDALLAYGAEGALHEHGGLVVTHNRFVNAAAAPARFIRLWPERLPEDTPLSVRHNRFHGDGRHDPRIRAEDGNTWATLDMWQLDPRPPPCPAGPLPG